MSERDDERRRSGPNARTTIHDWTAGESLSVTVLQAVADLLGKEPSEIQPVSWVVDADALNALFLPRSGESPRTNGRVSFVLDGVDVTVHASGEVVVERLE